MKKPSSKFFPALIAVFLVFVIALALVMIVREGHKTEDAVTPEADYVTVEYEGCDYRYREDVYNLLVIGVDTYGAYESSESAHSGGQADSLFLVSIDNSARTVSTVLINRDTYTKIPKLGLLGDKVGYIDGQLALSYAYGDGGRLSCENTVEAVSDFLGGIPIDGYFSVTVEGVVPFVDAIGGVEVYIEDDFSALDGTIKQGTTMLLDGKESQAFVQGRKAIGDQQNTSRMKRQKQFFSQLLKSVDDYCDNDVFRIRTLLESIDDYSYYSISVSKLAELYTSASAYTRLTPVDIEGEMDYDNDYPRFYADSASLEELVINTWYTKQ